MPKQIEIDYITATEALEAMRAIKADPNSYIHKRYTDDISLFLHAIKQLEDALEQHGGGGTSA